jgi:2-iminobutanoate/2-iminopropanoate deaminase
MINSLARTARMNATSILHNRFPTTFTSIARKSTLTQVFSDKVASRNTSLILSLTPSPWLLYPQSFHAFFSSVCHSTDDYTATSPHTSQAIKANGFVFLSAQLPCDGQGNLIKGSIKDQTKQMIENTRAVLEAAGSGLERVVKIDLSVKDFHMVEEIDEVFGGVFPQKPARSVQQVMFMEKGVDVMMDCVAVVDKE